MKTKLLVTSIFFIAICFTTKGQYTKLLDFSGTANGSTPWGSLISDGTFLYGLTSSGGAGNMGTIFKIKPDGSNYAKLFDFSGTATGSWPYGALVSDGVFLYGMTSSGGTANKGTVFKIMPDGSGYLKLLDFAGTTNGWSPMGSLFFDGTFLYGVTRLGGASNMGTIFKIKPDGSSYAKLLDFSGAATGAGPDGLIVSDGTFLYGKCYWGGTSDMGTIYKIMPDGTGFVKLLDFTGINGSEAYGSLEFDGTFLYGMTRGGGINGKGILFKIMPDGSGYLKLLDFAGAINGSAPGDIVSVGGVLYGSTYDGGANNKGTLFKIMPDGSAYAKLLDFSGSVNGSYPIRQKIFSDGNFLYGMTSDGGTYSGTSFVGGTIFKYGIPTSINENTAMTDFNVYPNPTSGVFTLKTDQTESMKIKELKVFSVFGEFVYHLSSEKINTSSSFQIDLSDQTVGMYLIVAETDHGTITKKIILE